MNTYDLTWRDYGNTISRNSVLPDLRPTEVMADSYGYSCAGDTPIALQFFMDTNDEAFLAIFEMPLTLRRRGA